MLLHLGSSFSISTRQRMSGSGFPKVVALPQFALCLAWVLMIIVSRPWGDYPVNDDWVYSLAVKSVLETGIYRFPSPASANVGPQVYWGVLFCLPFGFSFEALRLSTMMLGLLGVLALFRTLSTLGNDWCISLLGASTLMANPLYFSLANSYMTDVPFIACSIIAASFFVRGFRRHSDTDLITGILISLVVILIRQLGISLLVGFALAYVTREKLSFQSVVRAFAVLASGAAIHIGYQYWMISSGRFQAIATHSDVRNLVPSWYDLIAAVKLGANVASYCGLFLLPMVPLFLRRRTRHGVDRKNIIINGAFWAATLAGSASLFAAGYSIPAMGNVLREYGLGPLTLRDTYLLSVNLPDVSPALSLAWKIVTVISVGTFIGISLNLLAGQAWRKFREDRRLHWPRNHAFVFLAGTALAYLLVLIYASGHFAMYDRYVLVLLPLLILAFFSSESGKVIYLDRTRFAAAGFIILIFSAFSIVAAHDFSAWAKTRWALTEELVHVDKLDAKSIDGGYEFNGWYIYDPAYVETPGKSFWWVVDDTYVIASGPIDGYSEVKQRSYHRWLLGSVANVVLLKKTDTLNNR